MSVDNSSQESAVVVKELKKSFLLPHEKYSGIKQTVINIFHSKSGHERQKVLGGVSFEIKKGEFFGIVGRNGSGKSTLLKLLAGIYVPDKGMVRVNGSLTPFIELGVGFNMELTGRENVYMNGALLGFDHKQMLEMYEDIVTFAELENFMDQKLKNYSSGMQVRLAFSIAIRAKSDILILDEVLAVGDEAFQKKCISIFEKYRAEKRTIILVTHDMGIVEKFCSHAIMLEKGKIVSSGDPKKVALTYKALNEKTYVKTLSNNEDADISIRLIGEPNSTTKRVFDYNEKLTVQVSWESKDVKNIGIAIFKKTGEYIFGPNTFKEKGIINKKSNNITYEVYLNLLPGEYFIKCGLFGSSDKNTLKFIENGPNFFIRNNPDVDWGGITKLSYRWIGDQSK